MGSIRSPHGGAGQSGQGTIEWLGALLLVAALISALLVVLPSLGGPLRRHTICLVQSIFRENSCSDSGSGSSVIPGNEVVCATTSQTNVASDQEQVLFLKEGKDHTLIKTTYSNGEVQYTLINQSTAEVQAVLGEADGEIGSVGFDAELSAAAGGLLQGSHTWTFANASDADGFAGKVDSSGGWGAILHDGAGSLPGGSLIGWGLDKVGIHGAPNPDNLDPKNLTFSYDAAGAVGELNAGAGFGLGGAGDVKLAGQLKAALGARLVTDASPTDVGSQGNVSKGDAQFFITLSGNANGALQAQLFGPSATGSTMGQATAIVTVGPDGTLKQLQVQASGQYTAAAGLHAGGKAGDADEGEVAKALNLDVNDGQGDGYQYSATLNLQQDPDANQTLLELLDPAQAGAGVSTLMQQVDSQGTQRVQPFRVTKSQSGAGLDLEVLDIGGGASATTSSQHQGFSPGTIKLPGTPGWQPVVCKK